MGFDINLELLMRTFETLGQGTFWGSRNLVVFTFHLTDYEILVVYIYYFAKLIVLGGEGSGRRLSWGRDLHAKGTQG